MTKLLCITLLGLLSMCAAAPLVEYGVTLPSFVPEQTTTTEGTTVHVPLEDFTTGQETEAPTTQYTEPPQHFTTTEARKPLNFRDLFQLKKIFKLN